MITKQNLFRALATLGALGIALSMLTLVGYHTRLAEAQSASQKSAWAWGANNYGQLGDGTTTDRTAPGEVSNLSGAIDVSGGFYNSVAIKSDGSVWAWGLNDKGQLGQDPATTQYSSTPVPVSGLTDVKAVATFHKHNVALKNDGTVWAWGFNQHTQLGDGTATNSHTPVQVKEGWESCLNPLENVKAIAVGTYHNLAIKENGEVWAWGLNDHGQLGIGVDGGGRKCAVQVKDPSGQGFLGGVTDVSGGGYHSLALKDDGTVLSWGANDKGQLGDGTYDSTAPNYLGDRPTPAPVKDPSGQDVLRGITDVSGGGFFSLAVKNEDTVWAWGANGSGQLGDGTNTQRYLPVQVKQGSAAYLTDVKRVEAGGLHSLAIKSNGDIFGWGGGKNTSEQVSGLSEATDIGAGNGHSLAVALSPQTPEEQIQTLKDYLTALALQSGFDTSLKAKLTDALNALEAEDTTTACTALQDFVNQVNALEGKKISQSDADSLIAAAEQIMTSIECQ